MLPTYAVLALADARTPRLISTHDDSGPAFSAYRMAGPPAVLVRLEEDRVHGSQFVTVMAAKGVMADGLERDPGFRRAVRDTVRGVAP
jgi:hypothetical protein